MPKTLNQYSSIIYQNELYITGGKSDNMYFVDTISMLKYNFKSETWIELETFCDDS